MPVFLHGLALANYRGIGPNFQKMAPLKDFNFFIGANNVGKSSVLFFINKHLTVATPTHSPSPPEFHPLEHYNGGVAGGPKMAIGIPQSQFIESVLTLVKDNSARSTLSSSVETICNIFTENGFIWLKKEDVIRGNLKLAFEPGMPAFRAAHEPRWWANLWSTITKQQGGDLEHHWIPDTINKMVSAQSVRLPSAQLIPAIREIGPSVLFLT